jgi:hypothetical protein
MRTCSTLQQELVPNLLLHCQHMSVRMHALSTDGATCKYYAVALTHGAVSSRPLTSLCLFRVWVLEPTVGVSHCGAMKLLYHMTTIHLHRKAHRSLWLPEEVSRVGDTFPPSAPLQLVVPCMDSTGRAAYLGVITWQHSQMCLGCACKQFTGMHGRCKHHYECCALFFPFHNLRHLV